MHCQSKVGNTFVFSAGKAELQEDWGPPVCSPPKGMWECRKVSALDQVKVLTDQGY